MTYNAEHHKKWLQERYKDPEYRDKVKAQVRERQDSITKWFKEYKLSLKCEICGESHPACLDFHHRDPEEKDIEIARAVNRGRSIEKIKQEIDKCQVLCANCHRKLHYAGLV